MSPNPLDHIHDNLLPFLVIPVWYTPSFDPVSRSRTGSRSSPQSPGPWSHPDIPPHCLGKWVSQSPGPGLTSDNSQSHSLQPASAIYSVYPPRRSSPQIYNFVPTYRRPEWFLIATLQVLSKHVRPTASFFTLLTFSLMFLPTKSEGTIHTLTPLQWNVVHIFSFLLYSIDYYCYQLSFLRSRDIANNLHFISDLSCGVWIGVTQSISLSASSSLNPSLSRSTNYIRPSQYLLNSILAT